MSSIGGRHDGSLPSFDRPERTHRYRVDSFVESVVLDDAGRVECERLKVTAKPVRVPAAFETLSITGHELLDVASQPPPAACRRETKRGLRIAASQRRLDVAPKIRTVFSDRRLAFTARE